MNNISARLSPLGFDDVGDPGDPGEMFEGESAFVDDIDFMAAHLTRVGREHDPVAAAEALDFAFNLFDGLRKARRNRLLFSESQRDELLQALTEAHLGAEILFAGEERDRIVDSVRALTTLVVDFARKPARRCLPADRYADLIGHLHWGHNLARNIVIRDGIEGRARLRAMASIDFAETRSDL